MNPNYLQSFFYFFYTILCSLFCTLNTYSQVTQTFSYTGSAQVFTVPSCVGSVTIIASGAQGVGINGFAPGNGGRARGILNNAGGQILTIYVGGSTSAFNGGGLGNNGANGGGASDVRLGGISLNDRIIVAGGGGGAGGDNWACPVGTGHGGGGAAISGTLNFMPGAGGAGFASVTGCGLAGDTLGGLAGSGFHGGGGGGGGYYSGGAGATSTLGTANSGSLGFGGSALVTALSCTVNGSGGGGGGYYGGGGAAGYDCGAGRGGGGSSWTGTLSSPGFTAGAQTGNGLVTLMYNPGTNISVPFSNTTICSGTSVTLSATAMNSYTWTAGGGSPVTISNSSTTVVSPGATSSYTVSGTNSSLCVLSSVVTVSVDLVIPTLSLTASSSTLCQGVPANFTVSGASNYTWSTGSNSPTVSIIPAFNTAYSVIGKNACGISGSFSLNVNPSPTVSAMASTGTLTATSISLCSGEAATLTASGADTYSWTGGVPNNSTFFPPISSYYTVVGTNTTGCSATATVALNVVTTPTAPIFATTPSLCAGSSVTLSSFGYGTYTWFPVNSNTTFIIVSPTVTTTYTLVKTNFNCTDTKTFVVMVYDLPQVIASATPSTLCIGNSAVLSASGAVNYTWQPGSLSGAMVTVSPVSNTDYTITAFDGTCTAITQVSVSTIPGPTITISSSSSSICAGQSATLNASGGSAYLWSPGNYTAASIIVSPSVSTQFSLNGSFGSCTMDIVSHVSVSPVPTLIVLASKNTICSSETATLYVAGANTYSWSNGVTASSSTVNPPAATVYSVSGFYNNGCSSTRTIGIAVFEPSFAVSGPSLCCYGSSINLVASGALSYTWNTGSHSPTLSTSPVFNTIYSVSATSFSNGTNCQSTNTIAVFIGSLPNIVATCSPTQICRGETSNLLAGGAISYIWNTSQTGSMAVVAPTVSVIYTVQGIDANGCMDTAMVLVKVDLCSGLSEETHTNENELLVFPNPAKDKFAILGLKNKKLTLINQFGETVIKIELDENGLFEFHLQGVKPGMYFLIGFNMPTNTAKKVIVTD